MEHTGRHVDLVEVYKKLLDNITKNRNENALQKITHDTIRFASEIERTQIKADEDKRFSRYKG